MAEQTKTLVINMPNYQYMSVEIKGVSPLLTHNWSAKAKKEMLDKMMKKRKAAARPAKIPKEEYEASRYPLDKKNDGFPVNAFKNAIIRAVSLVDGITMVQASLLFKIKPDPASTDLVRIIGKPQSQEDVVQLKGRAPDMRYRAVYHEWGATLKFEYNADVISDQQLVDLLALAGKAVGVGEWRPEKKGVYGCFEVV